MNIAFNTSPTDPQTQAHLHAEQVNARAIKGGSVLTVHTYTNSLGQPLYWRTRVKHANGKKDIRAFCVNDGRLDRDGKTLQGQFIPYEPKFSDVYPTGNGKKPLYLLHELLSADAAGQAVYIAEGEQKAYYLTEIGLIATTSGGKSSANATDW